MGSLTPDAAALQLQEVLAGDLYTLRTDLSSYHEGFQAKMVELDTSCQNSFAALQVIASDAAAEVGNQRGCTHDSNAKIAAKLAEIVREDS